VVRGDDRPLLRRCRDRRVAASDVPRRSHRVTRAHGEVLVAVITSAEKDAWLTHMLAAVRAGDLHPQIEEKMVDYFEMAATHLINH